MNAVIVMSGATIIFTDDQGQVLDRYVVEGLSFASEAFKKRERPQVLPDGLTPCNSMPICISMLSLTESEVKEVVNV